MTRRCGRNIEGRPAPTAPKQSRRCRVASPAKFSTWGTKKLVRFNNPCRPRDVTRRKLLVAKLGPPYWGPVVGSLEEDFPRHLALLSPFCNFHGTANPAGLARGRSSRKAPQPSERFSALYVPVTTVAIGYSRRWLLRARVMLWQKSTPVQ